MVFSAAAQRGGGEELRADSSLLKASQLKEEYCSSLRSFILEHQGRPAPGSDLLAVSFRLRSSVLPEGAAAPWVKYSWQCDGNMREQVYKQAVAICTSPAAV